MVPARLDSLEKARGSRRHRSDAPLVRVSAEGHRYVVYHEGGRSSRSGPVRNGWRIGLLGLLRLIACGVPAMVVVPAGAAGLPASATGLSAGALRPAAGPKISRTVLANGLRVVVIENHALPLVQVAIWYRVGSANDPPGHLGIAHALEHMMFRGTRTLSGTGLDLVDARYGIESNAETDFEDTHFYQTAPLGALPVALRIEADRLRGLALRPRDWNLERQAVLAELAGAQTSDVGGLQDAVRAAAVGASPYAHDALGTQHDLQATGVDDLRRAYDAGYQPDNATLVVTGDVAPSAIFALARSLFGPIHGHAHLARNLTEPIVRRGFVVHRRALAESVVDVALEAHGLLAPDAPAEEIAEEILQPAHGALNELVQGDVGPCDSYEIDDDAQLHGGLIHIVCRLADNTAPAKAIAHIRHALRGLADDVSPSLIANAKRADLAATVYACDGLASEADLFGEAIALAGIDPTHSDARAAAVPRSAVAAVFRRWSQPVAVGIATGAASFKPVHARKPREERIASPAWSAADVEPAWARVPVAPYRAPAATDVEAFALPNGVRVFVDPRRGNGTAYLRGGFDRLTLHDDTTVRDGRIADRHAIEIDNGRVVDMHGFARDFPLMLGILRDVWRSRLNRIISAERAPRARHAWIAVTGDVDPQTVRADVTRAFASWHDPLTRRSPEPVTSRSPAPTPSPSITAFGGATPSVSGYFLLPAPARSDRDFAAMMLLDAVLGRNGDFDTRLVHEVRERRGLVYGIGSYYDPRTARLFLYFDSPTARFAAARTAVRDVLERMRSGPITAEERTRAYNKLLGEALRDRSSPDGILDNLSDAARERLAPDDIATLATLYGAVTVADIERVAQSTLRPDRIVEMDQGRAP